MSVHTTHLVTFDVILVMFDVINQAIEKLLPAAIRLNGWRYKRGIVNSMDRLVTSYERQYMYVAEASANKGSINLDS